MVYNRSMDAKAGTGHIKRYWKLRRILADEKLMAKIRGMVKRGESQNAIRNTILLEGGVSVDPSTIVRWMRAGVFDESGSQN